MAVLVFVSLKGTDLVPLPKQAITHTVYLPHSRSLPEEALLEAAVVCCCDLYNKTFSQIISCILNHELQLA